MLTCLYDVVGCALLRSTCLYACSMLPYLCLCLHLLVCLDLCSSMLLCLNPHAQMYIYMPTCRFPSLYVQISVFTCLGLCFLHALYYLPCSCVLHAMFMCLGLDLLCHAMCYCSPFVTFVSFSFVLVICQDLDLNPFMVLIIIHTPRTTLKGFGSFLFACLCLLASMLYACANLSCSRLCYA